MAFPPRARPPKAKAAPRARAKAPPRKPTAARPKPSFGGNPADMLLPGGASLEAPPPRLPGPRAVPSAISFSPNAPPLSGPSAPLGVGQQARPGAGHMSNYGQPKGAGTSTRPRVGAGMSASRDAALDKQAGIKPGSKKDNALDRKRGVPVRKAK